MKIGMYRLKNNSFQVSYIDSSGDRVRRKFSSYRKALSYSQKIRSSSVNTELVKCNKTIAELMLEYVQNNPDAVVRKRSDELFKSFLNYFDKVQCQDLNKVFCGHWLETVKLERNYSSRTLRVCKYTYSRFFKNLVEQGFVEKNYMAEVYIKMGTRSKHRVFLSESELIEILNGLKKFSLKEVYPVVYFLVHTGCKISEALSLKWEQLDFNNGTVLFPRTSSSNARVINLSSYILEFLKSHSEISDNVFLNNENEGWSVNGYYKCMAENRTAIDLDRHWDSFSFRHSFAYHFLKSGKTLQQLQVVLGHRYIAQTIQSYGDICGKT